ncbi:hypothetical protein [Paraburkholderia caballeronis]|uniref:hypothetical protein n=1 Tax=Paraburkholderia caballeronis TaxID=416943 RepID=UPI0010658330|nr:hypothetical protein [Paraburkholderia caballeronis]TDV00707.1 hypothetical protein C7408_1731 [Paraburkholderia caballeronis]TDV04963.1 hypothetical protein C7406_1681 [Paraburkholderia caballeronis]TDV14718.1 hypothetical protein C7404_1721 [Paraburkholderia caballeronis]
MDQLTTVGIDLAKEVFAVCVLDVTGAVLQRRALQREAFMRWAEQRPRCRVAMEALITGHAGFPPAVLLLASFQPNSSSRSGPVARTTQPMQKQSLLLHGSQLCAL